GPSSSELAHHHRFTTVPGTQLSNFFSCQAGSINQITVPTCLLAQLSEGRAQRGTGDLDQPLERPVELQDQKQRAGNRECADEKGSDYGSVGRGKEPKTGKYDGQPEHQHNQERNRDRTVQLLEQQHTRSPELEDRRRGVGSQESWS